MGKIISLSEQKFQRVNAGKVVDACNRLDAIVAELIFSGDVPASDLLPALCQRIGVYISCTDADVERLVQKLAKIIYREARKQTKP
jgi:hypothetical protein